jgi:hypothetical protein
VTAPEPETIPQSHSLHVSLVGDGVTLAAAATGLGVATLIPVDTDSRWSKQLLPIDDRLKGRYSAEASRLSDVLLAIDVALPVGLLSGHSFDREAFKRIVVYGETLMVSLALDALVPI